ncbi:MAG: bifunctional pyr operon transcriptional regulator/uracil phosphoribosyltransferase PyrR, partial [Fluviibacter sp.]
FDYGRPGSVKLAVLADRGDRQLPIAADFCVWPVNLPPEASLVLARTPVDDANGKLTWSLDDA